MRKIVGRKIIGIILLLIIIAAFVPWVVGILFQKNYNQLLAFYNSEGDIHAEIVNYRRGWFSSEIKLRVEILNPHIRQYLQSSKTIDFMIDQHIQHFQNAQIILRDWVQPSKQHVQGDMKLSGFEFVNDVDVMIPKANLQFDQSKSQSGLWLGSLDFSFPEMTARDADGNQVSISQLDFTGSLEESAGKLNGARKLDIQKLQINGQLISPLYLHVSVKDLDAEAIMNVIAAYQKILREGELYQSQLQQKMLLMLPKIIHSGSALQIDKFQATTPAGRFQFSGKLIWTIDDASLPDDFMELLKAADLKADLRISKSLLNDIIQFAATLPYFYDLTPEQIRALNDAQINVDYAMQQNALLISSLVDENQILEETASRLLELQRSGATLDQYSSEISVLFLSKKISPYATYALQWQYLNVQKQFDILMKQMDQFQMDMENEFRQQFNAWLKAGYIVKDKDDYIVKMIREKDIFKINDKVLSRLDVKLKAPRKS